MEDLIKINGNEIALADLKKSVETRIAVLNAVVVDLDNPKACDTLRTDTNKYIKGYESMVASAIDDYCRPLKESLDPILEVLKPLKEANKDLSDRILEAKKLAFRSEVKAVWTDMALAGDGEVPPFDECFDEKWYGKPKIVWYKLLAMAIQQGNRKNEQANFVIRLKTDYRTLADIESFFIDKGINYRVENGEDY